MLRLEIVQGGDPAKLMIVDEGSRESHRQNSAPGHNGRTANTVPRTGDLVAARTVSSAPAPGTTVTPAINAGQDFTARIVWLGTSTSAGGTERTGLIVGRIGSSPPGGPTAIQTPAGQLVLPGIGGLPRGSEIALRPLGGQPGGPVMPAGNFAGTPALTTLGSAWAALEDAHGILTGTSLSANPAPAAGPSVIPATGPQLASGMLLFLNALFQGNIQEWLGRDAMRVLAQNDRLGLSRRLSDDFTQLSRLATEPTAGEWRMAVLPLLNDNMLQQIRLYIRQLGQDDDAKDIPPGTRFVVEASLSRLGAIQLDGLVRPGRFDLMVRTHEPLPETMRADVTELFKNAGREFRTAGRIDFRIENPFSVNPAAADERASGVYA
ncbi:MAG: hypothetical protein JJ899_05630 [Alphaproteobacteria bacterium]|nr:hypothetical protein [Alphaproteobacteria bacterium]